MTTKYFWPPLNRLVLIIFIIVAFLITLWPLFKPGLYLGADGELHLGRITAYTRALQQGQFPVRWSDQLQYGYGSPIFIVTYPLPYTIGSLFFLSGLSLTMAFKLLIAFGLIIGAIGVYLAVIQWTKKPWLAVAIAIIYTLAPYHLVNAYLRVAIGELFLLTWPGWWLWTYFLTAQTKRLRWLILTAIFGTLIILSHQLLGGLTLIVLIVTALTANQIKPQLTWPAFIKVASLIFILAMMMSAWYWLPAFKESSYTMLKAMLVTKPVTQYLLHPMQVLYQPWVIDWQAVPAMLGIPLSIAWVGLAYQTVKRKIPVWPWLMTTGAMILCLNWTMPLWQNVELLHYFQTPWRLMNLAVLALVFGLMFLHQSKLAVKLVILLAIVMLIDGGWKMQLFKPTLIDENYYLTYPKSTAWHWEGTTIWSAGDATQYPLQPVEMVGSGQVNDWRKAGLVHTGTVTASQSALLVDQTFYFPGWTAYIDNQTVPIEFQNIDYRGLITLEVPAGEHQILIKFERTKTRLIAELMSLLTTVLVGLVVLFNYQTRLIIIKLRSFRF